MITWRDYQVESARRQEMLEQAERARWLRALKDRPDGVMGWYRRRIFRLGAWLEGLGCRLQRRYSPQPRINVKMATGFEEAIGGC